MDKLTNKEFRHFRLFLKKNKIYDEFMKCFREQKYKQIHNVDGFFTDYMKTMNEYSTSNKGEHAIEGYGALILTFNSFTWVWFNIPEHFTRHWCTISLKWALYCLKHGIETCTVLELKHLIEHWSRQNWINSNEITFFEKTLIKQILRYGDIY